MDAWVTIDGRPLLNFCANNYLGLANHPRIRAATQKAIDEYGVGPGAVRTIAGTMSLHVALEKRLAEFKKAEACITFQSGFAGSAWLNSRKLRLVSPSRAVSRPISLQFQLSSAVGM
jgi:glycine C-acetyltransferase